MPSRAPILIAGGGIGGLTAAVALRRAGFEVEVFERAPEIREVGAGIAIQPNAVRALRRIGLDRALTEVSCIEESLHLWTSGGGLLARTISAGSASGRALWPAGCGTGWWRGPPASSTVSRCGGCSALHPSQTPYLPLKTDGLRLAYL